MRITLPWKKYRSGSPSLTDSERESALITMSLPPVRTYLMQIMDELVRQGIYLSKEKQEGAKMFIEILGDKLKEADKVREKREKLQAKINERSQA